MAAAGFYEDGSRMHSLGDYLVGVAIFLVVCVLAAGLFNMARGGSPNLSQKLMRWRVGLQFVAILIILCVLFFRH
jgi:Hypoxia induced protein conserved region